MNTLPGKAGLYRWIILAAVIGIFCGVQTASAELWTKDDTTNTLEPNTPNDNVDVGTGNIDANALFVDDVLITEYISGSITVRLGNELVTNGDFSSSSSWTTTWWTISGGEAHYDENEPGNSYSIYQDIGVETGKKYRVSFKIDSWDEDYSDYAGSLCIYFGTSTTQEIVCLNENTQGLVGNHSYDVTATQSGRISFEGTTESQEWCYLYIDLDDVSVVEIISETEVRDVHLDPNLFVENDLDAGGDANVAGNLTVGGNISGTNSNWDSAYTKRVDTWDSPLSFSSNTASIGFGPGFETIGNKVYIKTVYSLGDTVLHNNSATVYTDYEEYTKLKEIEIGAGIGQNTTLRISFDLMSCMSCSGGSQTTVHGRIYRNGSPVGTDQSSDQESWETMTEDISGWTNGDLLQLYGYTECEYDAECHVKDLKIKGTITLDAADGDFTN